MHWALTKKALHFWKERNKYLEQSTLSLRAKGRDSQ